MVACLLFTLLVWWREEEGWTKVLLLPIVFIGLYSQYRAVKIILIGLGKWPNRRMEDWQEEKGRFTRETVSIEPVSEALPSLLVQVALLSSELEALVSGNRPNPLGDNPALFLTTFGLSALLAVMGLTHFLKDGPSPLISSSQGYLDGFISKEFASLFSSTFLWFTSKGLILSSVIYSRGHLSIVGIELPRNTPVAAITWVATLILPQLLHAAIVLATTTRWKLFSLIVSHPSFIITPLFTPFTYKGSCTDGKFEFRVSIKHTIANILITFLLTPLTMVLFYKKRIWEWIYNFGPTPQQISDVQSHINSLHENDNTIAANKMQDGLDLNTKSIQLVVVMMILPPILLLLSLFPTCHLLRNCSCSFSFSCFGKNCSCFFGNNSPRKHRSNFKFRKIGSLTWHVQADVDDAMEMVAVHGGGILDQETTGLLEDNLAHTNNESQEEAEDNLDHDEGENTLKIQNHDNFDDFQEDGTEQINELIDQLIMDSIL